MTVWLVRAGRDGRRENDALSNGFSFIGFPELGDLSRVSSKGELRALLSEAMDRSEAAITSYTSQIWTFLRRIQVGDIIALPLKGSPAVALGRVASDYIYDPGAPSDQRHRRQVTWIREDVPRSEFGQDLLHSLGAFLTVCRIQRNDAEQRIDAILNGRPDPGAGRSLISPVANNTEEELDAEDAVALDLDRYGRDRINSLISRKFAGHRLTTLIDAVLQAEGYHTHVSPPGPDGGVDILAGSGPMGFEEPRICVQVKTGEADAPMLRDLQGTMGNVQATHGLFVAWGGFKRTVRDEERRTFFGIRMWDSDDVITQLIRVYDRLPAEIRDDLPLTQVWTVVEDDA